MVFCWHYLWRLICKRQGGGRSFKLLPLFSIFHFLNKIWRPNEQKFYEGSGLVTPSIPPLAGVSSCFPCQKFLYIWAPNFFHENQLEDKRPKNRRNAKLSFCLKEEIRKIEMGKTSQTITNPASRIFHIISLQLLFVSLNSAFYVNISPDNAF